MCESEGFEGGVESAGADSYDSDFESSENEALDDSSDASSEDFTESEDVGASSENISESENLEDEDIGGESTEEVSYDEDSELIEDSHENAEDDEAYKADENSEENTDEEDSELEEDTEESTDEDLQTQENNEEDSKIEENSEIDEETRKEINEKSEYSQEVNDHIHSVEELEVYQNADLKEEVVDGRTCLVREDLDLDYVDEKTGKTNRMLMEMGRTPYDAKTGEQIELHHIGQEYDSPLAEVTANTEHGDGNHKLLHEKTSDSWRNDSYQYNHYNGTQRPNHWKARVQSMQG